MKLLALVAAALLLPQEKNEAEALFKKMEEKILQAKTIQGKYASSMNRGLLKMEGEFIADAENRFRVESEATARNVKLKEKGLTISDGKQVATTGQDPGSWLRFATPETYGKSIRIGLARHGMLDAAMQLGSEIGSKADPEKDFTASNFRMGKEEKINGRATQQILYRMGRGSWQDDSAMVWIDKESMLPVKRSYKMEQGAIEENYSDFKLDEKIDPTKFELPASK